MVTLMYLNCINCWEICKESFDRKVGLGTTNLVCRFLETPDHSEQDSKYFWVNTISTWICTEKNFQIVNPIFSLVVAKANNIFSKQLVILIIMKILANWKHQIIKFKFKFIFILSSHKYIWNCLRLVQHLHGDNSVVLIGLFVLWFACWLLPAGK